MYNSNCHKNSGNQHSGNIYVEVYIYSYVHTYVYTYMYAYTNMSQLLYIYILIRTYMSCVQRHVHV